MHFYLATDSWSYYSMLCFSNAVTEKLGEHELEGKLGMKIAYIENEKAQVRQWHRILSKLCGDKLHITILQANEAEVVRNNENLLMR